MRGEDGKKFGKKKVMSEDNMRFATLQLYSIYYTELTRKENVNTSAKDFKKIQQHQSRTQQSYNNYYYLSSWTLWTHSRE